MFLDGIEITSLEHLESLIVNFPETTKTALRCQYTGDTPPAPNQQELDYQKYRKRAAAINTMMAEMASENVTRVRSGIWTVNDLVSLTQDVQIKEILTDLMSLSFEIAYSKIDGVTNPLITSEIKAAWKLKLASNFY